jgi:hypothetical protein
MIEMPKLREIHQSMAWQLRFVLQEQLALHDHDLYKAIMPDELYGSRFAKVRSTARANKCPVYRRALHCKCTCTRRQ